MAFSIMIRLCLNGQPITLLVANMVRLRSIRQHSNVNMVLGSSFSFNY